MGVGDNGIFVSVCALDGVVGVVRLEQAKLEAVTNIRQISILKTKEH
jgi:hypothetical protein